MMRRPSCHPLAVRALALVCVAAVLGLGQARGQAVATKKGAQPSARATEPLSFTIRYEGDAPPKPLSGRLYVMTAPIGSDQEPRSGPNWFRPTPFFARDVRDWDTTTPLEMGNDCVGFPAEMSRLPAGLYKIQAVFRVNRDSHKLDAEGNYYGPAAQAQLDPELGGKVGLVLNKVQPPDTCTDTDRVRYAECESPMLTKFFGRPIKHRAAVILPEGVAPGATAPKRPVLYIIPGFGGDRHMAPAFVASTRLSFGKDLVRIVLDPDCGTGHHVFADSATNGPRGKALVEEFIPYLESKFPIAADPAGRLLTGHSSGGWSSLWLQVSHPDFFGGVWSTAPDPVDFRDFQRINIYAAGENMFRDREGNMRPIARMGGRAALFYVPFSRMDDVIGWGGQLGSFEAVFSPLDRTGAPRKLWDRRTGAIDPETAKAWEAYDIRLVLERNWATLGPRLKGKLHVYTGSMDTFYLEGAVKLLKESLARLGSDATIEIVPDRDHGSLLNPEFSKKLDESINAAVRSWRPAAGAEAK